MLIEITVGFVGKRLCKLALGLGTAVGEAIFSGAFFDVPPLGSFAGRPQIDDFSHDCLDGNRMHDPAFRKALPRRQNYADTVAERRYSLIRTIYQMLLCPITRQYTVW